MAYSSNVSLGSLHPILDDCRTLGNDLEALQARVDGLETQQASFVLGTSAATQQSLDRENTAVLSDYRVIIDKVRSLRARPEAGESINKYQLAALDRKVRKSLNDFRSSESRFVSALQDQQRCQYRVVYPDASEQEIDRAVESGTDVQVFQQALLNADRKGHAQTTLSKVKQRHEQIQDIERTLVELQSLFETLDTEVVHQDYQTVQIDDATTDTVKDLEGGTRHMNAAAVKAWAARKKKWICLGITLLILVLIALAIVIWLKVTNQI